MNCSEVLKLNLVLKFIYDYYLNSMNSRQKLEIISSFDCSYNEIFLISILVFTVIQFSRTQLLLGKDLMLVMVFSGH